MPWLLGQWVLAQSSRVDSQASGDLEGLATILIILLMIATGVALVAQRLRIPYVTGLVLAGLPITEVLSRRIGLDPSLVLNLFLPILIFEAGINTDISRLRSTFKPIALLAGPGAVFSSAIIAVLLKLGLGLTWIPALLIGVILANTDTVSMIAAFKEIRVPSRLSTIVEGETLFNDAAALVSFNLILTVYETGSLTFLEGVQELLFVALGGSLVGLVVGYLSIPLFIRLDNPLSSLLLTVAISLGTFQVGQFLSVSGAVAVTHHLRRLGAGLHQRTQRTTSKVGRRLAQISIKSVIWRTKSGLVTTRIANPIQTSKLLTTFNKINNLMY
jgi:CPA1 family monovalent cation:H+ antiporter